TPRIRFRIRTIMLAIAAVAIMLGVLRLMSRPIRLLLETIPKSDVLPVTVFAVVLFGSVVEFLVFWVYFYRRRKRPINISQLYNRESQLQRMRYSQARAAKPGEGGSDLTQLPSAPIGHSQHLRGYPPNGIPSSRQESDDGPSI